MRVAYSNASASAEQKAESLRAFESALDGLDGSAASHGGPFLHGAAFSSVDAMYAPFLERWAAQLPLTAGVKLRAGEGEGASGRWPALERWYGAMEAERAPYGGVALGDAYSWAAAVGTFQRMGFGGNGTDEAALAARAATLKRADAAAAALRAAAAMPPDGHAAADRVAAARALVSNRE